MRSHERNKGLLRAPKLAWEILVGGRYSFVYDQMPMTARRMSAVKRFNLLASGANLLYRSLRPWSMPLHMQFELTNYCNLRCPVCPTGSRSLSRAPQAMNVRLFERVMNQVGPYLLTASLWAWGEPLLHPSLKEILRIAREHDVITLLSTNGQLLCNQDVLETLVEEPPDYLIVAFDGLTDSTNSVYRVGGRLRPILDGVNKLAAMRRRRGTATPVLNMRFIVMKHNQHEVASLDEFAVRHGFELLTIRSVYFLESTTDARTSEVLAPEANTWATGWHAQRSSAPADAFICMEPFWFPTVFADGTLVLCEQDYNAEMSPGRIAEDVSFNDLWFSEGAAQVRKMIRESREMVNFCRKCHYADRPVTDCNIESRVLVPEVKA